MTTYYVGAGGNDGNTGLSWAQRFLTLNGAEDEPVVANDTVYVAPGVYRELLILDVNGTNGNPITYIGDVTGENTDGVGGIVRITASDNDQTATRANVISDGGAARNYRTFRGFMMDMPTTSAVITMKSGGTNFILQDCFMTGGANDNVIALYGAGGGHLFERCFFMNHYSFSSIYIQHSSTIDDSETVVQNCVFMGGYGGVRTTRVGGITVRNCTMLYNSQAIGGLVSVATALATGTSTIPVNNCIMMGSRMGLYGTVEGEIIEDYNAFYHNSADRTNVAVGGNSVTYPPLFAPPILFDGIKFPWWFGELSEWSQVRAITGSGEASDDMFGMVRPTTSAKKSWGPMQFHDVERATGTVHAGVSSAVFHQPARKQIWVPVENEETVFSTWVYREDTYTGTLPQMRVMQPSQSTLLVVDTGAVNQWNLISVTGTVAGIPPYAVVELISNHVGTGSSNVFFDDLAVS